MGALSQDNLKASLPNPQRTYLWDLIFTNPVGGGDGNILSVRVQTTVIPGRGVGKIPVHYKGNAPINYAGKTNFPQQLECNFIEGEDKIVHDALVKWLEAIRGVNTGVGVGDELIKQDIYLTLVKVNGGDGRQIRLVGCFPTNIGNVQLGYETEGIVTYPVTFSYDNWVPTN